VSVRREVRRAFEQAPESHRGDGFVKEFQATKQQLCELTNAAKVELLLGSGTLANDVIAGQIAREEQPGLVLSNGEFGERLLDHALRSSLPFEGMKSDWGEPFDLAAVRAWLDAHPDTGWLWCAHCETSTGALNDLAALKALCAEFRVKLCLDAISSLGTVPVDLAGVWLAAGTSGKGLRAYPGVSMVFYHHDLDQAGPPRPGAGARPLPRYLDLRYYTEQQGIPFTFSSNLLHALHAAVKHVDWERRFAELQQLSAWARPKLCELGFDLVAADAEVSPAVITVALPSELESVTLGNLIRESGYLLSYNSEYLRKRNWIQICFMGECAREKLVSLLNALKRACSRTQAPSVEKFG